MLKKILIFISVLCIVLAVPVSAKSAAFSIKAEDEFWVSGENLEKVCEILGISENEFSEYCSENGIKYLAVNSDNTKQITLKTKADDFSSAVINISTFSDDKILSLLPDIVGIENIRGEIVSLKGQKFVKVQLKSSDSGGEFTLTEYITVADRQTYILSFYTAKGEDTSYIEKTFESFECEAFISEGTNSTVLDLLKYILPVAIVIFTLVCGVLIFTIIKDIRTPKEKEE